MSLNQLLNSISLLISYILLFQVIESAAKLNIPITINQVGNDTPSAPAAANVSPIDRADEWKPAFAVDEDGLLHQLRATLAQVLDACMYYSACICLAYPGFFLG